MQYTVEAVNPETFSKLYTEFGFTARRIGEIFGVTEDAILKRLKQYGIATNPRGTIETDVEIVFTGIKRDIKKQLTDETLLSLNAEGKTDREIGLLYGLTGEGVAYRRKKLGIGVSKKPIESIKESLLSAPRDVIEQDYYNLSQDGFSEKYKVSKTVWRPVVQNLGIENKSSHRVGQYPALTAEQKALIIGGLLGDGGIDDMPRYYESHSLKQEQYLRLKMKIMEPYTAHSYSVDDGTGLRFYTVQHPVFSEFRDIFYKEGVKGKLIPVSFISENWDDKILAYWFLDDGYYDDENRFVVINNYCPVREQLVSFVDFLEKKFKWGFQLYDSGISFSKKYYKDFFDIVFKVATSDVLYKVPEEFLDQEKVSGIQTVVHPKFYRVGDDVVKARMSELLFSQYWGKPFPYSDISESRAIYLACSFKRGSITQCVDDTLSHNTSGMELCDKFFPNIYECKRKGSPTPVELWKDEDSFRKLMTNRLRYANRINDASIRKGFKLMNTVVGNFKPAVARYVYKNYCTNGKVLDYCSGFGSRMLAAMSLGLEYVGYEPNTKTHANLLKFGEFIKANIGGTYNVLNKGSETDVFRPGYFSLAFSSPPYFDYEIYSDESSQSISRFPDLSDWLTNYWGATIKNCTESLCDTGVFGVCLSPNQKTPIIERTMQECRILGFKLFRVIKVPFKHVLTSDGYEVILLFSRTASEISVPDFVHNRSVAAVDYGFCTPDEPDLGRVKRAFPVNFDCAFVQSKFVELSSVMGTSRDTYDDPKLLGVPAHVLEHHYGGWNSFVRACGVEPGYVAKNPVEHVKEYLSECLTCGETLSFYEYEKRTKIPATRLKRIFNAGRPYAHLKEQLFSVALDVSLHEEFLKNFK